MRRVTSKVCQSALCTISTQPCLRTCSTASPPRLVDVFATADGVYTVALNNAPVNVLSQPLLEQLTASLMTIAQAAETGKAAAARQQRRQARIAARAARKSESTEKSVKRRRVRVLLHKGVRLTGDKLRVALRRRRERRQQRRMARLNADADRPPVPRGVVLTSAVRGCFSGGLDLDVLAADVIDRHEFADYWQVFQQAWHCLNSLPIPIVAAVNGNAPAAGCILGLCCDSRVMAQSSPKGKQYIIGITACKGGFSAPPFVAASLAHVVGTRFAERMLCDSLLLTADKALAHGLVDEVVPVCTAADLDTHEPEPPLLVPEAAEDTDGVSTNDTAEKTLNLGDAIRPKVGDQIPVWARGPVHDAAVAELRRYLEVPGYAFWMVKEQLRRPVLMALPDPEARAKDTLLFHEMLERPAVKERLTAYRRSLSSSPVKTKTR